MTDITGADPVVTPAGQEKSVRWLRIWSSFPRDWWSFLKSPRSFLLRQDLTRSQTLKRALKYLLLGTGGAIAFSAVNLKFSLYATSEASKKLFEGRVLANVLVQSCILSAFLSHFIARVLRGTGKLSSSCIAYSFAYSFIWPTLVLALIAVGWFLRLFTGQKYAAIPPFDVEIGTLLPTTRNILVVAVCATLLLWLGGWVLYCYGCTVQIVHKLSVARSLVVVALTTGTIILFERPLAAVMYAIAETLDPLLEWIEKLLV
jgi:hypothetical protein